MAIKYLEIRPDCVLNTINEGNGVWCFDKESRESVLVNSCTVNAALQLIKRAEAAKVRDFTYDSRGDFVSRITFWTEVRSDDQPEEDDD